MYAARVGDGKESIFLPSSPGALLALLNLSEYKLSCSPAFLPAKLFLELFSWVTSIVIWAWNTSLGLETEWIKIKQIILLNLYLSLMVRVVKKTE